MRKKDLKRVRAAIILFYAVCTLFFVYVMVSNPLKRNIYGWLMHDPSKFHCPSCGLTRAVYCLATFDFKHAFYYHALFTVLSPVLAYIVLTLTVNLFAGRKIIPYPKHYPVYLWIIFGLYIAFGVLRNFTDVVY